MAKQVPLKATVRAGLGRTGAKKTRSAGKIPAVIYSSHIQPTPIQLDKVEVDTAFKKATSENLLVDLSLEENGKTSNRLAFIQDIQHHPFKDYIIHLDFHEIRADEQLHARVAVVAVGEAEGVKTGGGVLEQTLREFEVSCLPKDLPDQIEVDISALVIGASLHVNEIKVPAGVTVLNKPELPVFSVQMPKEETLTPAAAATTAAEPELIKKKGEEGEEGKAPEAGAKPAAAAGDAKAAPKADKK